MSHHNDITGLILAGGAGRRVGGRDKGTLLWNGTQLARGVADRLRPQVDRLLISCNRNTDFYRQLADAVVLDLRPDYCGPLAGVEAAARLVSSAYIVLAACDTPNLPQNLVTRLHTTLLGDSDTDLVYVWDGSREQYLFACLRRRCLSALGRYLDEGGRSVAGWYATMHSARVDFSGQTESFANLNSLPPSPKG